MIHRFILFACLIALNACDWATGPRETRYLAAYGPSTGAQRDPNDPGAALPDDVSYWAGDGVSGSPLVRIDLSAQKAFFYKGGQLVGVSRISTGSNEHATPTGRFRITQKSRNHRSNLYGIFKHKITGEVVNDDVDTSKDKVPPGCVYVGAPMPYFMRFNGGIGMHTGYLPGYNASHGCVRMPHKMAKAFFENVAVGTPVVVQR
jgi:hypothetical protein